MWSRELRKAAGVLIQPLSIYFLGLTLFAVSAVSPHGADKINYRQREKQILDQILGGTYDNKIRPSGANGTGPTIVSVNLYVRSIATIDDVKMEQVRASPLFTLRVRLDVSMCLLELACVEMFGFAFSRRRHSALPPESAWIYFLSEGPTQVSVNLYLRSISKIDDYEMEYSVQLTFREQWLDERLKFDQFRPDDNLRYLTLTDYKKVWMPDLFFSNEKTGHLHEIIMPNVYIRIFPNGEVLYSIRISLTLSCPMILKLYPLDKQTCSLRMASYGWTTTDLIFKWKQADPVQVTSELHLPRFALEQFKTDYCDSQTNTGIYSCLRVDLLFKREFSYYLIQIYIPCCMLVIVSWVSFWLDQSAVPARVSLGVTTLLTMATQTSGINQTLPPVSYTKALDVWTGVCLTFVFGALLEFALVNYASRSDQHRENVKKQRRQWELEQAAALEAAAAVAAADHMEDSNAVFGMKPLVRHPREALALDKARQCEIHMAMAPKREGCARTWLSKFPSRSKRIDVVSRITFPLIFALFNLAYWCAYLLKKEDQQTA